MQENNQNYGYCRHCRSAPCTCPPPDKNNTKFGQWANELADLLEKLKNDLDQDSSDKTTKK